MRWVFVTLSDKGGGFMTKMVAAKDFFFEYFFGCRFFFGKPRGVVAGYTL